MQESHSRRAAQSRVCDLGFYWFLTLHFSIGGADRPKIRRDTGSTKKEVDSLNAFIHTFICLF